MKRSPFSLYTKNLKNGNFWYVRFFNPETEKYDIYRSTGIPKTGKRGNHDRAFKAAMEMLEAVKPKNDDPLFLTFLLDFWSSGSPYLKTKELADRKPLSKEYINQNYQGIKKYVVTYSRFNKVKISQLNHAILEDWKLYVLEKGIGIRRFNAILQSIKRPVRYAHERQMIPSNPCINIKKARYIPKEKGVLDQHELRKLLTVKDPDPRVTLTIYLAVLCGLRRGEVRGLQWGDIDQSTMLIRVQHNYIDGEGIKSCKWDSNRTVLLHKQLVKILRLVRNQSSYTELGDFVLSGKDQKNIPITKSMIRWGFTRMLKAAGISEEDQKNRNLTFHGLRHTFVTLARISGLPDIMVQALAGHKSSEMMDHYSHGKQAIDFEFARKMFEGIR